MKQYIAQMTIAEWHFMSMLDEINLPDTVPEFERIYLHTKVKLKAV
jgi:hypothetical protein